MQLSETLLALMSLELGPELEVFVKDFQCFFIVTGQLDFLPELTRQMGPFDCLHVEVTLSLFLQNGSVASIRQRTGVSGAQASKIVLVSAESLRLSLLLEGAVSGADDFPNYVVLNHIGSVKG